jgi:hypothetical protein
MIINDIKNVTMCCGEKCEIKDTCFRYLNHWDAYSYVRLFPESPFVIHNGKQFCPKYINPKDVKYERDQGNS